MIKSDNYRSDDKSLARLTFRCILFDGENIYFDASLVIYIKTNNIPPIMFINRIYKTQNLLSLLFVSYLVGLRTYQHPCKFASEQSYMIKTLSWLNQTTTGMLISPLPDRLPDVFFYGENISFDASLVIYKNSTNIPPIMIINRIYETQSSLSP
jgi:hypothetical protein